MKFEKLNLDAFCKTKLEDNKLRSVNGGEIATCDEYCTDTVYPDGSTEWDCGATTGCDECDFSNC